MFLREASWRRELVGLFETGCRGVGKFETLLLFFWFLFVGEKMAYVDIIQ